jgi:hypothetical protein
MKEKKSSSPLLEREVYSIRSHFTPITGRSSRLFLANSFRPIVPSEEAEEEESFSFDFLHDESH